MCTVIRLFALEQRVFTAVKIMHRQFKQQMNTIYDDCEH